MDKTLTSPVPIRAPREAPPPGSCDCQIHVYGDPMQYPVSNPQYAIPANVTFEDAARMHDALGIDRCIIVQTAVDQTNHSYLLDVLSW